MRERRKIVLFVHIDDSGCINVEIDEVCATDDDRSEQETIVYTISQRENIYSQSVLEPECRHIRINSYIGSSVVYASLRH